MKNRDNFIRAEGKTFNDIPALNDNPAHIRMMKELVIKHTMGWLS